MLYTRYALQNTSGLLTESGDVTSDPNKAITFGTVDTACKRVLAASGVMPLNVRVVPVQLQFPSPHSK